KGRPAPAPRLNRSSMMNTGNRKFNSEKAAQSFAKDMMFELGYTDQDIHVGQTKNGQWYAYPTEKAIKETPLD
ncbi:MAG: hypothetical protein OEZ32_10470, partial [Nitrospinota bacterium]|nr:hypothetical protein [Nitrospinota bacterium]